MKTSIALFITLLLAFAATAQAPDTLWTRTFGGNVDDIGYCVQQTADGGYIVAGMGYSSYYGDGDVYLVKTDVNGNQIWQQTFGGNLRDYAKSVQQTSDGGYILAGDANGGAGDALLIKTDSLGNLIWQQTFGWPSITDQGYCAQQTNNGGYILFARCLVGGLGDVWLIKTDASGIQTWAHTYGGTNEDYGHYGQQTADGGYIIAGATMSYGAGDYDVYLIKIDSLGNLIWQNTYGGTGHDMGYSVQQTTDGGYIIAGKYSYTDIYLIKTDDLGNLMWERIFNYGDWDEGRSIRQTEDGGYIAAGFTNSFGAGNYDVILIKIDENGNEIWHETIGGWSSDVGYCVQQTTENGFVITGRTASFGNGNQVYLIKTEPDLFNPSTITLSVVPFILPIQIPASGGSFSFYAFATNEDTANANVALWTRQILPNGTLTPAILGPYTVNLTTGTRCWFRNQNVPGSAPPGEYKYIGYAGVYPNAVWSTDTITYTKLTTGDGPLIGDWANTGDPFFGENTSTEEIYPSSIILHPSHPNPFNPTTAISFKLQAPSHIRLAIWDTAGRLVTTLVDGWREAGAHEVTFDGSNLPSGVYLYRLATGQNTASGKMVLLK
jgi:hypothetical protein